MKCPRCKNEIDSTMQYCPHCGCHIKTAKNNRIKTLFLLTLSAVLCFVIPLGYYRFMVKGLSISPSQTVESNTIGKVEGDAKKITGSYSIDEFKTQFSNANDYLKYLYQTENELSSIYGSTVESKVTVFTLDNNDVFFGLRKTFSKEGLKIKVKLTFDCNQDFNEYEYTYITEDVDQFESLFYTDAQLELISHTIDSSALLKLEQQLYDRKETFELKKETLGHYGLGVYDDTLSNIIKRHKDQYFKVTIYKGMTHESNI